MSMDHDEIHKLLSIVHQTKDLPKLGGIFHAAMRELEEHHKTAVKDNEEAKKAAEAEAAKAKAKAEADAKTKAEAEEKANTPIAKRKVAEDA